MLQRNMTLAVLGSALALPVFSSAQVRVRSTATAPCAGCILQIDSLTTIGNGQQEGAWFGNFIAFAQVTATKELVVTGSIPVPSVFDLNGNLLRVIGRKGNGPGEFAGGRFLSIARNGDLYFPNYDRISIYRPDGSFKRDIQIDGSAAISVVLNDGSIAARYPDTRRFTVPRTGNEPLVRLFDTTGKMLRAIGRNGVAWSSLGPVAGSGGTIWTGLRAPFVLREWAPDGTLLRTFERVIPNFDDRPDAIPTSSIDFVQPHLNDFVQASDGLLWAIYSDKARAKDCGIPHELCTESVVEVLDPATGALIATRRFPSMLRLAGEGYLARIENTSALLSDQRVHITLYSVKLIRPGASPAGQ